MWGEIKLENKPHRVHIHRRPLERIGNLRISRVKIKNWRNFKQAEAEDLSAITYILGPNASGKSNFLDSLRFLRDIAKTKGGGLQEAIESRGGISKVRCLHARADPEVLIEVDTVEDNGAGWNYIIAFNLPKVGFDDDRRPYVTQEKVTRVSSTGEKKVLVNRPNDEDEKDSIQRQQTYLEQLNSNADFRELKDFFGGLTYYHLVPQLLKFGSQISGRTLENDPFGQEFLIRVSRTQERVRNSRLRRIESALRSVVPQMEDLRFTKDSITGHPHLEIKFKHYRPHGAKQREDQFSDGTLRLIALFWLLQEGGESPLLLEEPELSLNEEIVGQLARIVQRLTQGKSDRSKQVFISTHSKALLSNPGIDSDGIVVVEPSENGSTLRKVSEPERIALMAGLSPAEVVLPNARGKLNKNQLAFEL